MLARGRVGGGSEGRADAGAPGPAAGSPGRPLALGGGQDPFPGVGATACVRLGLGELGVLGCRPAWSLTVPGTASV